VARQDPDHLRELLSAIPELTGRAATAGDRSRFQRYLDLFTQWNQVHRMTALRSPAEIARGLFLDSLLFLPVLPTFRPIEVVDIGAGSGVPGLPMRIVDSEITLTLVEAKRKRASFLLAVCRELGLSGVKVIEGRAEGLVREDPTLGEGFDVVVARAVAPASHLFPLAMRYLRPGGIVVLAGGPGATKGPGFDVVKVPIPGQRTTRVFLRGVKRSNVPRGT
jgi:16S rRNA (guanine527-N7)-methyltransferase